MTSPKGLLYLNNSVEKKEKILIGCLFLYLFLRKNASSSWRKGLYLIGSWIDLETVIIKHRKCDLIAAINLKNLFLYDFIFLIKL